MRLIPACAAVFTLLGLAPLAHADDVHVTIEGTKQGKFKGSGETGIYSDKNRVVKMDWGLSQSAQTPTIAKAASPVLTVARRTHQPLVLTFHLARFTPQLFQAAATNETLKSLLYEVAELTPEGETEITNTIRLTNARIVSIKFLDKNGLDPSVDHLVEVAFAYQKIEIENKPGKVMASDDWIAP